MIGHGYGRGMNQMMGSGNYGFIWFIVMAIILLILFFLIYKLLQQNKQPIQKNDTNHQALSLLKERYAKGELTDEEFMRMKKVLEDNK